jgi:glucosyl-dolichyl phosphate glucuronosyltransferase
MQSTIGPETRSDNAPRLSASVVICTYNRGESLVDALESVARCNSPEWLDWEILVVDNNSTDRTREIVQEFCRKYPRRFRYYFEKEQGLCPARNAGIREARGEVIVFTDDDITVEPTWLETLVSSFKDKTWAGAGGRVVPVWTCPRPKWLALDEPYAMGPLVMFDRGEEPNELTEAPFGANMAFRKCLFEKHGGFREDLGNRPGSEIRNDDSEFGARILARGERLRYEPSAIVYHPVPEKRLQKEYVLAWWFGKGRGDIRQYGVLRNPKYYVCGIPIVLFRNLAVWTLRWMLAIEPRHRFKNKVNVWEKWGEIVECYSQARARRVFFARQGDRSVDA